MAPKPNLASLLAVYMQDIPASFDADLVQLCKRKLIELEEKIAKSHMREAFARDAHRGNYSRCDMEDQIYSLAEGYGLEVGVHKSNGGSSHVKISTDRAIITVHTLGDIDKERTRHAEYKRNFARMNPNELASDSDDNSSELSIQTKLLLDDDINKPKPITNGHYIDERLYYMIYVPRLLNQRYEFKLVMPSSKYNQEYIIDTDYLKIRANEDSLSANLYTDNEVKPIDISMKDNSVNEIFPTLFDEEDEESEDNN